MRSKVITEITNGILYFENSKLELKIGKKKKPLKI